MTDELFQDILETTMDGELPINGEIVVETDEGPVTLDEADMMEDAVIEALENAVVEAVASHPDQMRDALRALDEALAECDYENAVVIGCHILSECGVDETRINEIRKGMKLSAGQRQRMARARKKSKTGAQRMALRARRMAARKSSARMKRKAFYKRNKVRIAKRRQQLASSMDMSRVGESFVLTTELVVQKLEEGMMFVVLADGYDPYFTETQEEAAEVADTVEGASIHTFDIDVIEEAKHRAKKSKAAKKGEMPADGAMMEKGCATEMDYDDEMDDEEDDEEEYSDDEMGDEEDDEMGESLDESAAEDLAKEVASFIQQHPMVGYGELATHFKIGRDVAQQAMILAGKVAGTDGEDAGWMALAKEILFHRVQHSAGATPGMTMRMAQSDMRESLDEAKRKGGKMKPKPKMAPAKGNKAGAVKVAKAALPAAKLKGQAGAIPSVHAPANAGNADVEMESTNESELVDVTTSISNQDRLLAIAEEHGVSSDAKITIADNIITLSVPKAQADAINQALSV